MNRDRFENWLRNIYETQEERFPALSASILCPVLWS